MAEELKELIEKIQLEGVRAAEEKADGIVRAAQARADEIAAKAARDAGRMVSEATERIKKLEEGSRNSVKQAARDALLSLKREIASILEKLVATHVHKALTAEEMSKLIVGMIKCACTPEKGGMAVSVRKDDIDRIEKALTAELGRELKKGITIREAPGAHGGFHISYDAGKSYFDFSEKALADYISAHLKAGLAEIVKSAASE